MPRPPRLQYPGGLYHVTARGTAGQAVFPAAGDRELFLTLLARTVRRCGWLCHAFCLMGNHYHLLVETPAPNLAVGAQWLNGVYAQTFNRLYGRAGHLFQGRYHAAVVEKESHLLEVARYIALNPVRAGLCNAPEGWRWSSYRATAGHEPPPPWLVVDWLLGQLGRGRSEAQARYRAFVADGMATTQSPRLPPGRYLGSREFVSRLVRGQTPGSDPGSAPGGSRPVPPVVPGRGRG